MSAVLASALLSSGTCHVTPVEPLEVQYTLSSILVCLLPWWMNEWASLTLVECVWKLGFQKRKSLALAWEFIDWAEHHQKHSLGEVPEGVRCCWWRPFLAEF